MIKDSIDDNIEQGYGQYVRKGVRYNKNIEVN